VFARFIKPTLRREKLTVIRVDQKEHNRNINEVLMEELRAADLVIADLTYARRSVYFEAGFAERSAPVIYTARSDHFRSRSSDKHGNLPIHFDVSMRNVVAWTDPSDPTFCDRLAPSC
jgi:nucleoside 2-deoxyribosyltransferase